MVAINLNLCCWALSAVMPRLVSYPDSTVYSTSLQSYWSQQEVHVTPSCVVSPTTAPEVSLAVKTLTTLGFCKFAVRSGGHTPFAGSANMATGVTIDLAALNQITLSADKSLVTIGPGQRWGNVYAELEPLGLAVAGGRSSSIGVGGLTLGGGTFYFAPREGFTCDNVESFEVVLADGSIVTADAVENSDLFVALKGGSNNFGIVTQITYRTFALGPIWAGNIIYPVSTVAQNIQAFSDFISAPNFDQNASMMQTFGYTAGFGGAIVNAPVYAAPVVNPPAFQNFTAIQPQMENTMAITTLSNTSIALDASSPGGFYQILASITIENDVQTLQTVFDLWNTSCADIANVSGIVWTITTQPINNAVLSKTTGLGNSLGLPTSAPSGSFIIVELAATWSQANDSTLVTTSANELIGDITAAAKALGTWNRYIDLNHATTGQDPISSYGPTVKAKLLAVSKKYDRHGVFQKLVTGGFKLR